MTYIHQTTFHTENVILYGIFHVMHEMRLMPITRVLTDSPTYEIVIGISPNGITHWTTLQYLFEFYQIPVFLWVVNFWGLTVGFARLPTLLRTFIARSICLTKNRIWVFHLGGGGGGGRNLTHLASPKHTKFIIIILCTHESQVWTLSQFSSSLHIHQEW